MVALRFTSASIGGSKNTSCLSTHIQRYLTVHLAVAVAVAAELWHCKLAGSPVPVQLKGRTLSAPSCLPQSEAQTKLAQLCSAV